MVLETTLESPLDKEEIKPVNPKGNQFWLLIGRTDAEAKLQCFGHLMQRASSFRSTLKIDNRRGRGDDERVWWRH